MEHRDRNGDELGYLIGGNVDDSFEDYLARKAEGLKWLADQVITETPLPEENTASAAEESSRSETTDQPDETQSGVASLSAHDAEEKRTKLELRSRPLVGSGAEIPYVVETTEAFSVDAEWQKVFNDTYMIAVVECTAEQVIKRYHDLDRAIYLMKAQQNGLRVALETLLKAETASERNRLLEMDRKHKVRQAKKAVESIRSSRKPSVSKGKSKAAKAADTLFGLKMSKAMILGTLKTQGILDDAAEAYVNKLFA